MRLSRSRTLAAWAWAWAAAGCSATKPAPPVAVATADAAVDRAAVGDATTEAAGAGDAPAESRTCLRPGAGGPSGTPVVLTDDGGWSWFQSPRVLLLGGRRLVVGSVSSGWSDPARRGDVEAVVTDLASGASNVVELHDRLELDDHDSAVFLPRPDGRLLALYAKHGTENHFYSRLSAPDDPLTWMPETTFAPSPTTQLTYSNLFLLTDEANRVYDFYRGLDASYKPSYATSNDLGGAWTSGNVVVGFPSTVLQRPYVRYASNGRDTIHLVYTDAHPRDFDNSLYHIYYRAGVLYESDGMAIRPLAQGLNAPGEGTRIFQGDPDHVAWSVDVVLDGAERPVAVYSVQVGSAGLPVGQGGDDIRYRYARWDGTAWRDHPLAYAGSRLYSGEDDYSGLVAIDPGDPSIVYLSTNADPATGAPLASAADGQRHYELYLGATSDGGATWAFTPITQGSTLDNLRPIAVADGGQRALVWLRGQYRAYTDYQQQVVALFWCD